MCLMWKFHLPGWPSFRAGVVTGQALCVPNHFSCGLTFGPRISLSTGEETTNVLKGIGLPSGFSWGRDIMKIDPQKKRGARGRRRGERS